MSVKPVDFRAAPLMTPPSASPRTTERRALGRGLDAILGEGSRPSTKPDAGAQDAPFAIDADALTPAAPRFRILNAAAIWAPRPPTQFVVAGMLPRGSLAMLCATGSSLKTWGAVDLLTSRAAGHKWLGRFDCEKGSGLFVDWESGEDELCRRLARLSAEPVEGVALLSMPDLFFNSDDFENVATEWAKAYGLVVFDSLAAGTIDLDENDARFAQGLRVLKRVAAATGAVFVVLHHSRKGRPDGDGDDRDAPRGTSAIFAAVDVLLQLSRADEGTFMVRQTKARGGKAVDAFVLRVNDVGERTTVLATDAPSSRPKTADAKYADVCRRLIEAARAHPDKTGSALVARVDGTDKVKWAALNELVSDRRLVNLGSENRPRYRVGTLRETLRRGEGSAAFEATDGGESLRAASQGFQAEKTDAS